MIILLGLGTLTGCSAEAYRRSADRQVKQILREREDKTLGYRPQVQVSDATPAKPTTQAYAKIPATPIPPTAVAPLEPATHEVPAAPLGPELPPEGVSTTRPSGFGLEAAQRQSAEMLRLGPPAPHEAGMRLDLFRSLGYAAEHSRNYQNQMEELYLTTLDVTLQRHLFEPRPFVQAGLNANYGAEDVNYRSALNATATAGIRQQLPYGGEVVAKTLVGFVQALHGNVEQGESAEMALSATIPLLRGAGMVNLEPLIQSERTLVYRVRQFEDFRRQFAVDVSSQYFRLITAQQSVANRRANYISRINTFERTLALYGAGRLKYEDVQRALQNQLQTENDLTNTQASYEGQLDSFKVLLGMPIEQDLEIVPVELQLRIPELALENVVRLAMQYRLDLQTARDQIEDSRRQVAVAQNGLMPDLNFTGDVSIANRAGTPAGQLQEGTMGYNAGLTLDLPIDRLAERNAYRRALIKFYQAQRGYEDLRAQAAIAVRSSIRTIQSAQISLRLQQMGINLAEQRQDLVNERLKTGNVSFEEVENAQNALLTAQDAYENARAQLQISLLQYLRQTGTLRLDPQAGMLGQAMERSEGAAKAQ